MGLDLSQDDVHEDGKVLGMPRLFHNCNVVAVHFGYFGYYGCRAFFCRLDVQRIRCCSIMRAARMYYVVEPGSGLRTEGFKLRTLSLRV